MKRKIPLHNSNKQLIDKTVNLESAKKYLKNKKIKEIIEIERRLKEYFNRIKVRDFSEVWESIKDRII